MKHTLLAALLFTLSPLIGQNADAVKAYLGAYRFDNVAPPTGPVEFVFSRTTLNRQADGKATYKTLLKTGYFQDAGNYGRLSSVRITENGRLVPVERYTPAKDETGTLTRADVGGIKPTTWALPDSTQMEQSADVAIKTVDRWKAGAWAYARPVWRVVMYVFSSILVGLFWLAFYLRYIAATAASESAVNVHGIPVVGPWIIRVQQSAAGSLLLICWVVTGVIMANIFMWVVWLDWPLWLMFIFWFPVQFLAEKMTNWFVPNLRVIGTKQPAPASNNPRLPG